jgi:hypothetical protein
MFTGGSKIRGASDQPTTCPFCGATLRQARNLRRHLEMLHFGVGKVPASLEVHSGESHSNSPAPLSSDSNSTLVVLPSSLCQPVMEASEPPPPPVVNHSQNVNCLQPPSTVASSFFSYSHPDSLLDPQRIGEQHASAFRGVGVVPRPDPGSHSEV